MNWSSKSKTASLFLVKLSSWTALYRSRRSHSSLGQSGGAGWSCRNWQYVRDIKEIMKWPLPIIGHKRDYPPEEPFITATMKEVDELAARYRGHCAWLFKRPRHDGLSISRLYPSSQREISRSTLMADISTLLEAGWIDSCRSGCGLWSERPFRAIRLQSKGWWSRFELIHSLCQAGVDVIAEGKIHPDQAGKIHDLGVQIAVGALLPDQRDYRALCRSLKMRKQNSRSKEWGDNRE